MVGAVLVHKGNIIGEGWHTQYGQPHAERDAIANIAPHHRHLLPQSTLYVNLEPCAHYGKTPPCADYIIECGIKRVVIACGDPFAQVAGKGIEKLRAADVEVIIGILAREAKWLNRRFITFQQQQRPYIILKWAQTANGYFAPNNGSKQRWISNPAAQTLTHRWRTEEQAIMIGTQTARTDNPQLNARLWQGLAPTRIVIDRQLSLPTHLHLFDGSQSTLVFSEKNNPNKSLPIANRHTMLNANMPLNEPQYITLQPNNDLLPQIWQYLYTQQIQSVIVEGGAQLLNSIIAADIWDEARIFTAPNCWNNGVFAPALPPNIKLMYQQNIGDNTYRLWVNSKISQP